MKIRIFALAKELNMDSKELIEACAEVGIVLKNSALASISPEERDKVVQHLKEKAGGKQGAAAPSASRPVPPAPVREPVRMVGGKVPELKSVAPRPQLSRLGQRDKPAAVATTEPPAPPAPPVEVPAAETAPPEEEVVETAPPVTQPEESPAVAAEAATVETPAAETPASAADVQAEEETQEEAPAAEAPSSEEPSAPAAATAPPLRPAPPIKPGRAISRDDYIPASGTSRAFRPREIGARDAGDGGTPRGPKRPKTKPGPALPTLAPLGKFKGPSLTAKQEEAPAQKPDLKLPADLLTSPRPLHDILKKNAEDKKKRRDPLELTPELAEEGPARPGSKLTRQAGGAGLSTSRRERQAKRTRGPGALEDEAGDGGRSAVRVRTAKRARRGVGAVQLKTSAEISPPITIRSLSEALGRPASMLIKTLFMQGMQVTMNSALDDETAMELAMELGIDLKIHHERDIEQELMASLEAKDAPEDLVVRPPIITILGHVDHGKTTLLDTIRSSNVVAGEAGGITQHIAAYQVERNGHKLTFVDTPGHAAFGEMRARGANVTDIVVLVVAADDGVMPQTAEAISHAKAAGVPIVVALNKIDLPSRNDQKVLQELSAHGVLPVEWGGDVEVVRTSGLTGAGIDDLLETLLVTAELHELKGNPNAPARGVCLEAFRDEGRGTLAWLLIQRGTLRIGDVVLCGEAYGRIRAMYNDRDEEVTEAGLSCPVKISGLDVVPHPGDHFFVLEDLEEARQAAENRRHRGRSRILAERGKPRTLEDILDPAKAGSVRDLPLIIKADTPGSIEAIKHEMGKFSHPEVRIKILHEGVGGVNESDVYLASAGNAIIVAFHVVPEERARVLAEREGVEIRQYSIIYELTDQIRQALEGLLKPELHQIATGRALVLRTFNISRFGTIAGCRVLNGTIDRSNRVRLIRDQRILNDYAIASLKREKDDVKEVREGMECGIRLENFNDIKEGDLLEAYRVEEVKRTL